MKGMRIAMFIVGLTAFGFAVLQGCAETTESEKGAMMGHDKSMKSEKAMMAEPTSGMMEKHDSMMEPKKEMKESKNEMMGSRAARLAGVGGHHATGTVAVAKDSNGSGRLALTDISIDRVPDGRVYLAKNGDYTKGIEVGKLTQFSGTVTFPIPANVSVEEYDSVVIWCKKFNVEIGHAFFDKQMM
jgi:Electron transfer DM13